MFVSVHIKVVCVCFSEILMWSE